MINVGIIGLGYWGSKVFDKIKILDKNFNIIFLCDKNIYSIKKFNGNFEKITNYKKIKFNKNIDAIFICTNPITHFNLCKYFLNKGIHVFVEKPICNTLKEYKLLTNIAKRKKLILYEDLIFLHDERIQKIKKIIKKKSFGKPILFNSHRTNLGGFQFNTNVLHDLLSHDLSILVYLFGINSVKANGILFKTIKELPHSVANLSLVNKKNFLMNILLSWHSPIKIRKIEIVGSKQMITYDGLKQKDSLMILKKSFKLKSNKKFDYRIGDILSLNFINNKEPLIKTILEFSKIIKKKKYNNNYSRISENVIALKEKIIKNIKRNF